MQLSWKTMAGRRDLHCDESLKWRPITGCSSRGCLAVTISSSCFTAHKSRKACKVRTLGTHPFSFSDLAVAHEQFRSQEWTKRMPSSVGEWQQGKKIQFKRLLLLACVTNDGSERIGGGRMLGWECNYVFVTVYSTHFLILSLLYIKHKPEMGVQILGTCHGFLFNLLYSI